MAPASESMETRKRKRMQSNRDSARRSRMRKQKHMEDLTDEISRIKKLNGQILASMSLTMQLYVSLEAENSVLRARLAELSSRLRSLNDIIDHSGQGPGPKDGSFGYADVYDRTAGDDGDGYGMMMNHAWGDGCYQPVMASGGTS